MKIIVKGTNIETGQSLASYTKKKLQKTVSRYFENAVKAEVHFSRNRHLFHTNIIINEGAKHGITITGSADSEDVYQCFNEALEKSAIRLEKYKKRLKKYHNKHIPSAKEAMRHIMEVSN